MRIGMGMEMEKGVTKDGMGMDQGWNGNRENEMTYCLHLHTHLPTFTCAFVRRQRQQPRAVRTDGGNRTCSPQQLIYIIIILIFTGHNMKTYEAIKTD